MKSAKLILPLVIAIVLASCGTKEKKVVPQIFKKEQAEVLPVLPLDKGFSEFITGYTSGIIPANGAIEIRFTPEFASKAKKDVLSGIFSFSPSIKGKTEWKDETTLVFTPSKLLNPGIIYQGELDLSKIAEVKERLSTFPLRIQTIRKDFTISAGTIESSAADANQYQLNGELTTSDVVGNSEVESYLEAKLGKKNIDISWDHSEGLVHKFTIGSIRRTDKVQVLTLMWDGASAGIERKGTSAVSVPASGTFDVIGVTIEGGQTEKINIIFSNPVDASQNLDGLIYLSNSQATSFTVNSNIVSLVPVSPINGKITLKVTSSVRDTKGKLLDNAFEQELDFTGVKPGIELVGNGVIVPSSKNLIFPFKAANLKAVDLKISKIYENNLPYFLQTNEITGRNSVKRFGKKIFAGRVDLAIGTAGGSASWKLYTIDLSEYIETEPGVLYMVQLGMRKSYTMINTCPLTDDEKKYEEALDEEQQGNEEFSEDGDNYYDESDYSVYWRFPFNWSDRDDPCKGAYYTPEKNVSRNILASNLGIIAKMGEDNKLHVTINDLLTALPINEVSIEVYDFQMQLLVSGNTNPDGVVALACPSKPFLVIAKKDKDRNYLRINDGASLSLSSFDVSGNTPQKGLKAFVYGERDVWRPGDSIYLSIFVKDMTSDIPPDHPVQFELWNPSDQRIDNQIQKLGGNNLITFATRTTDDAVTGNYSARFKIGGATFYKTVRIETIKPNRLKINLSFPSELLGGSNGSSTGSLNVKWLNGTIAKNLDATVDYLLKKTRTSFDKYPGYEFDDPGVEFSAQTESAFIGKIDENGNASFRFDPGDKIHAPGMLTAVFTTKVKEQGGDESINQTALKYAPYSVFAGIKLPGLKGKSRMLYTDADNEVNVVTVNENGKPVRSEVEMTIYKLSYRWWWESDNENIGYYISNDNYQPVLKQKISTSGGEGKFTFKINKHEWGRYYIKISTPGGHSTGKILLVDWPWEYGMKENSGGATLLAISTDKDKYHPGDEIKLTFPTPENSRAIITLENATGVLDEIRVPGGKGSTQVTIKATPEMAPNVYAYVSVIQPHAQSINDMPVRLYGIVPVMVEDPGSRLSPQITVADEIRSQKPFEVKVSEADKKEMTYTLAIVDEGLLDITNYKTPDPWNYFYGREALGVKTWDIYDFVLGAFGGTLERIFAIGGDEALADKSANKVKRFLPVVKFLGPFNLPSGKTNTHKVTLPQYTGSVKVMVIAGNNRAFGSAEKSVLVKDPLMVLVTAPRVISPGEKCALPVTIFIQKDNIRDITLKAEGNELIKFLEPEIRVTAAGISEKDAEFTFTSAAKTGKGKIKVTAEGGGEKAVYELELEVRTPNPAEVRAEFKMLKPGEKWETSFDPFGLEEAFSAKVEVSQLPSVNLGKRMDYLLEFPHGCSEQITSGAFPQLWLKDLSDNDPKIAETSAKNVKAAINKLLTRQMSEGGIALWPESTQPDNWVTSYAGHFMLEAERMGYNVPSGFRNKWISYQSRMARSWSFDNNFKYSANDQAYRLFTLALAGHPERGAMNRMREIANLPKLSRWLLAAAFATTGRPEAANGLLDIRVADTEPEYYYYYYGSRIRDKAIILYTLTLLKNDEKALELVKELSDNLSGDYWYSTQSISWALYSYMKWVATLPGEKNATAKISFTVNGEQKTGEVGPKQLLSNNLKVIPGSNSLKVENTSQSVVYATLMRRGVPLISDNTSVQKGLVMKVDYLNLDLKPIDPRNLVQGTSFMMVVKITNPTFSRVDNLALTQMVPSGWEIQNTRIYEADYGIRESVYDYRDFRDDRINTYFTLVPGDTKTFVMILTAAYRGEFSQPAIYAEAMYTENCYARVPGGLVKVTGQ